MIMKKKKTDSPKKEEKIQKTAKKPSETNLKATRLYQNLRKVISEFIQGRSYKPVTFAELVEKLNLPEFHLDIVKDVLQELIASGTISIDNTQKYRNAQKVEDPTVTGSFCSNFRGFGFVAPLKEEPFTAGDIFIPKHLTKGASDGDIVQVIVTSETGLNGKGPEGKVVEILKRRRNQIAGTVLRIIPKEPIAQALIFAPLLGSSRRIVAPLHKKFKNLKIGDRVVVDIIEWGKEKEDIQGEVCKKIGNISDPMTDIPAAILEFNLRNTFTEEVQNEIEKLPKIVHKKDIEGRTDFRQIETFTIDPETARDYDDALSLSKDSSGEYHLIVHIADVSHYVAPKSAIDIEAFTRCNSTYLPGFCLPMLPHELSSNLCSLKEKVNRLAISVSMDFDPQGNLINYKIERSVIRSQKRFTYEQAKEIIDGKKRSKYKPTLNLMVELCEILKEQRRNRGSVEFSLNDNILKVSETGEPLGLVTVEYDISHQLVEEFMLKANEVVATHLSQIGIHIPYRVHEEPSEENMSDFAQAAAVFGFTISSPPTIEELQNLFQELKESPYAQQLSVNFIKSMRLAIYSSDNIGHYGLSLEHYAHFTSPIRRYSDLVLHRALFEETLYSKEEIDEVCQKCSDQERMSAKAEGSVILLKKMRLLKTTLEQNPGEQLSGIITKVRGHGLYFEVQGFALEGFIHISEVGNDYFIFDEAKNLLFGKRTSANFGWGNTIQITPTEIDLITMNISWKLIANTSST